MDLSLAFVFKFTLLVIIAGLIGFLFGGTAVAALVAGLVVAIPIVLAQFTGVKVIGLVLGLALDVVLVLAAATGHVHSPF